MYGFLEGLLEGLLEGCSVGSKVVVRSSSKTSAIPPEPPRKRLADPVGLNSIALRFGKLSSDLMNPFSLDTYMKPSLSKTAA